MSDDFTDFTEKVKNTAQKAGVAIEQGVDIAAKKAGELYEVSKTNLKLFNLQNELDDLYKEFGRICAASDDGAQSEGAAVIREKIAKKLEEIAQYKAKAGEYKKKICPRCTRPCARSHDFCPGCGTKLG